MKRYFITGTDTDCGKTYVTSQLASFCPNAMAIKPIASGCHRIGTQLVSSDAQELIKNTNFDLDLINPWRFELPVSPHIAAAYEGVSLDLIDVVDYCSQFELEGLDTLFIEGAGGLMVPLNQQHTWLDFLRLSKIPVLLVVGMKLGCINHALLTDLVLKTQGIECIGWIANCIDPKMLALDENIDTLNRLLSMPLLSRISYLGRLEKLNLP
jgi:dethiobiotin synthetase